MRFILSVLCLVFFTSWAAAEWPLDKMNKYIEETNWFLDKSCSATTIDAKERLLLTNFHCVDSALARENGENFRPGDVFVSQRTYDDFSIVKEVTYSAAIIAVDPLKDLALIQIRDPAPLPSEAKLSKRNELLRGEKTLIVGNPEGLENTLVIGYVSSPARSLTIQNVNRKYFQMSGGVTGGASGGAVYNENGELIGVTAAGSPRSTYIGFAIPLSVVKDFLMYTGRFPNLVQ